MPLKWGKEDCIALLSTLNALEGFTPAVELGYHLRAVHYHTALTALPRELHEAAHLHTAMCHQENTRVAQQGQIHCVLLLTEKRKDRQE